MNFEKLDPAQVAERKADMMAAVGLWKDRADLADSEAYVRNLRGGTRLARLMSLWRRDEP
jgi:hypothetical protein